MGYVNKTYLSTQFKNFADKIAKVFSKIGHTHLKSDITDFPTSMPANGGNAATVGGHTVGVNVPSNAKFTDTTYSKLSEFTDDVGYVKNTDARLTNARPASDVYAWAKASSKPSYSWNEITSKPSTFTPASHTHDYLPLSGGTMTGSIKFQSSSLPLKELQFICGIDAFANGGEMGWQSKDDFLSNCSKVNHTHLYAGSSSAGGSATSAVKLDSSAGSATQPVYFSSGKPVACTYTLGKSVPSNAVFTDTWRGIQNNLTSDSTTDSLSAAQGKVLKGLVDGKAASNHTHSQYLTSHQDISGKLDNSANGADSLLSKITSSWTAIPTDDTYFIRQDTDGVNNFGRVKFSTLWSYVKGKADKVYAALTHTHTKSEVGLGNVDNTADSAKSVKYATSSGNADTLDGNHASDFITANNTNLQVISVSNSDTAISLKSSSSSSWIGFMNSSSVSLGYFGVNSDNEACFYTSNNGTKKIITTGNIGSQSVSYANTAGSAPASDVYAWAKASSKPSYSWSEITGKPSTFTPASHTHTTATTSLNGFMSSSDKSKLDSIEEGATARTGALTIWIRENGSTSEITFTGKVDKTISFNNWEIGTTSGTVCAGNDSRLSNARPASDVYAWAKATTPDGIFDGGTYKGNIDSYTESTLRPGKSYYISTTNISSNSALPFSGYGILTSYAVGSAIVQQIFRYNGSSKIIDTIYTRMYINSGWTSWSRVALTKV